MKADVNRLAYIGKKPDAKVAPKRDSDAWVTPPEFPEMAREVMGQIDLDPFSSASANVRVKAKRFFDENDDAHEQIWFDVSGTVFMNPPYSKGSMDRAVNTFLDNYSRGLISEAIVLVNNATEVKWFRDLLEKSSAFCLPSKRIKFENDDGKNKSNNTRGQVFFYFGENVSEFHKVFQRIGMTAEIYTKPTLH